MKKKKQIKKALQIVNQIIPLSYSIKIEIKFTREMKYNPNIMGLYFRSINQIYLNPMLFQLSKKIIYKTIFHEIGHSIHWNYFQYQPQYLPRKYHGNTAYYCNSNQKESFAECFADYIWCVYQKKLKKIEKSRRLTKMQKLLLEKGCVT